MSTTLAEPTVAASELRVIVDVPASWDLVDPPIGIQLVAADPHRIRGVRSNLVVTAARGPGVVTVAAIDAHLASVLEQLSEPTVEILDVIVDHNDSELADRPTQRIIMHRRFDGDADEESVSAEVCQQHRWVEGHIVIATLTMPLEPDADVVDDLLACLESVDLEPSTEM